MTLNFQNASKKLSSTVLIDNDNYRQLPRFVDLLVRDGQMMPDDIKKVSEVRLKFTYLV